MTPDRWCVLNDCDGYQIGGVHGVEVVLAAAYDALLAEKAALEKRVKELEGQFSEAATMLRAVDLDPSYVESLMLRRIATWMEETKQ